MRKSSIPPRTVFQYRDFRIWQLARAIAVISTQIQVVALGWHLYGLTGRALDLGFLGLAQFAPTLLFSLIAGHAADRFERRRVLVVCQGISTLCILCLYVLAMLGHKTIWPIYAVALLLGTGRSFYMPTAQAILPQLTPARYFADAVAWNAGIWQLSNIVGPAVGGLLLGVTKSLADIYMLSGALSLVSMAALSMLVVRNRPRKTRESILQESLFVGIRFVFSHRLLLGLLSLDLFAVLLGGATALLPAYARDILNVGPGGLGILRSAPAAGAAVVAIVLAHSPIKRSAGLAMLSCVGVFGLATIAFGLSRNLLLSLLALCVLGAANMVSVVVRHTLVQISTPDAMRGRVSAVNALFIGASNELGEFESGLAAAWFGLVPAVVMGGVGTVLVVVLWAFWFPELRKLGRLTAPTSVAQSMHPRTASIF